MSDHTVLPATRQSDIPAYITAKLVFDLATPEGCKTELSSWLITYRDDTGLPPEDGCPSKY